MKSDKFHVEVGSEDALHGVLTKLIGENDVLEALWRNPEQMDRDALILRNDVDIGLLEGLNTQLNDGDSLLVLPLIHGG
ncbi:MAG: MoaD/ThiS family protein [Candidatus Thorarchaeota archaeon]